MSRKTKCLIVLFVGLFLASKIEVDNPYSPLIIAIAVGMIGRIFFQEVLSGLIIPLLPYLKISNVFQIKHAKVYGTLEKTALISSTLRDLTTSAVRVANSKLVEEPVWCDSERDGRKISFTLRFSNKHLGMVKELSTAVRAAIVNHPETDKDNTPVANLSAITDNGSEFLVSFSGHPADPMQYQQDIQLATIKIFMDKNIQIIQVNE